MSKTRPVCCYTKEWGYKLYIFHINLNPCLYPVVLGEDVNPFVAFPQKIDTHSLVSSSSSLASPPPPPGPQWSPRCAGTGPCPAWPPAGSWPGLTQGYWHYFPSMACYQGYCRTVCEHGSHVLQKYISDNWKKSIEQALRQGLGSCSAYRAWILTFGLNVI